MKVLVTRDAYARLKGEKKPLFICPDRDWETRKAEI